MRVTGQEVNEKQFHDAWRGYNQEEVDDFLDRVAEAVEELERENEALKERMSELDLKIESARGTEEMLRTTLQSAQVAAQEAISNARAKAEEIVADAEERAQRARDELRMRVETAEEEVRRRTDEIEREQEARRQEIRERVDRLQEFEGELKRRMRSVLEQQMASLEVLESSMGREGFEITEPESSAEPVADSLAGSLDVADETQDPIALDDASSPEPLDVREEPRLEDFSPLDEEEAFGTGRRRKRGLFRREPSDAEVGSEEI